MRATATISSKGQVTLPKAVRDQLGGRVIEFIAEDGRIEIRRVESVAGSLAAYSKGGATMEEVREATWGNDART
ncbi:MAG: AbrB/MazE/SpoVT family DNA-binding domain-containing protein [Rectinemataceae bacterium]